MPADAPWLIFVDTNVFLDFYRLPGERSKRQLDGLLRHRESLIVTEQIHMEYLKNRQKVISDGLNTMKRQPLANVPAILAESKYGLSAVNADKKALTRQKKLEEYANRIMHKPSVYDKVYKTATKLFNSPHQWNLRRPNDTRFEIRDLAQKRFQLGYPPRKASDNSIGDAINWEWIIYCAKKSNHKHNVLIVSRDSDYGLISGQVSILNDWLRKEFRMRVGARRQVILTNKLTIALKKLDEVVTPADEEAERVVIEAPTLTAWQNLTIPSLDIDPIVARRLVENFRRLQVSIPNTKIDE